MPSLSLSLSLSLSHPVDCSITVGVDLHEHDGHLLLVLSFAQDLSKRCLKLIDVQTIAPILVCFLEKKKIHFHN